MGQEEVIKILKKAKKPMSRSQIAKALKLEAIHVSHLINKLLKYDEIKCFEVNRFQAAKLLGMDKPFRRMRFYYYS